MQLPGDLVETKCQNFDLSIKQSNAFSIQKMTRRARLGADIKALAGLIMPDKACPQSIDLHDVILARTCLAIRVTLITKTFSQSVGIDISLQYCIKDLLSSLSGECP